MKERYEWYKLKGICPRCGQENAAPGRVYCLNCLDLQAIATMKWRSGKDLSEKNKADCRKRYLKAKAEGICVRCYKRPARKGRCDCDICNRKIKSRYVLKNRW